MWSSTVRPFESPNVVGIVSVRAEKSRGKGAAGFVDQAVLYTAHYDHLGMVCRGWLATTFTTARRIMRRASGMLLEDGARLVGHLRSGGTALDVIFSAVTAEEQGLLGSEYLGQHPPVPTKAISLDLNYDMILPVGVPEEINVNGAQRTNFYPVVQATAKGFGLAIVPDPRPEAGSYYRSDHFSLSRVGIPAFSIDTGAKWEGHDLAWGQAQEKDYNEHRYHNFADNYTPDMNFEGNAKLARFGMDLGWKVLERRGAVEWLPGDEFEAARKKSEAQ